MVMVDPGDPSSRKPPYKVQWHEENPRVLVYGGRTGLLPLGA